jgi:anthranilate/para-aminobenzoate synthase component II
MVIVNKYDNFTYMEYEVASILFEGEKTIHRGKFHCRQNNKFKREKVLIY